MGLKFWIPTGLSILALSVSVIGLYYTEIRQVDRVSMVTKDKPIAFLMGTGPLLPALDAG